MLNPREELVFLLRGFFSTPLLTVLGKRNILNRFLEGPLGVDDLEDDVNSNFLEKAFVYLQSIGLLAREHTDNGRFLATPLGEKIFKRYGSFVLLYSYRDLISDVDKLLFNSDMIIPKCDRLDNVIGSGLTNGRKFFPAGIKALENTKVSLVVDLACGDGEFLSRMHQAYPGASIIAADLSPVAIDSTKRNLLRKFPDLEISTVQTNALDVENWVKVVDSVKDPAAAGKIIISMWYLVHEIAQHDPKVVAKFFKNIYEACPDAELLIGEIINIDPDLLATSSHGSIMPEFMFFHELSGQGVLSWDQYQDLLELIPYDLIFEERFDLVGGGEVPSAIVWHLQPK